MFGYLNRLLKKHPHDLGKQEREEIGHLIKDLRKTKETLEDTFGDDAMGKVEDLLRQLTALEAKKGSSGAELTLRDEVNEEEKLLAEVVDIYKHMQKKLREAKKNFSEIDAVKEEIIEIEEQLSTVILMSVIDFHGTKKEYLFFLKKGMDINRSTMKGLRISSHAFGNLVYTEHGFKLVSHSKFPLVASSVDLGKEASEDDFVTIDRLGLGKPYYIYAYDQKSKQYSFIFKCVLTLMKKREWMDHE